MHSNEDTFGQVISPEEATIVEELLGPDWRSMSVSEGAGALEDALAREAAKFAQVKAEHEEAMQFSRAVTKAMRKRGATYAHEVYDDVARELYGHHTPLTRRVIAEVEALAS
jgi:hypothetical protein